MNSRLRTVARKFSIGEFDIVKIKKNSTDL